MCMMAKSTADDRCPSSDANAGSPGPASSHLPYLLLPSLPYSYWLHLDTRGTAVEAKFKTPTRSFFSFFPLLQQSSLSCLNILQLLVIVLADRYFRQTTTQYICGLSLSTPCSQRRHSSPRSAQGTQLPPEKACRLDSVVEIRTQSEVLWAWHFRRSNLTRSPKVFLGISRQFPKQHLSR